MPGRSEDKLFWCIVLSLILMFIKGGFAAITILWAYFFVFVLPKEIKRKKRSEEYADLQRHPNKYKKALLRAMDICGNFLEYYSSLEDNLIWWNKELDAETREYIRKTSYYDHPRFRNIKNSDNCSGKDKEYLNLVSRIGKENMEAILFAQKIGNGKDGLDGNTKKWWWRNKITPEAREIIRKMECYNNAYFTTIKYYDEEMKRLKSLPEYRKGS